MSHLEDALLLQLRAFKYPTPEREVRFAPPRRWRLDLAYRGPLIAVEVEGGTFVRGRHARPIGMRKDAEKYNELAILGWLLVRVTSDMVTDGTGVQTIGRALRARGVCV